MTRANVGTHAGDIYNNYFAPTHTNLDAPDYNEVTDDNVMRLIQHASGTASHILEGVTHSQPRETHKPQQQQQQQPAQPRPVVKREPAAKPAPQKVDSVVSMADEDEIRSAIKEVRTDTHDANWVLVTYIDPKSKTLKLAGTGSGGLDEMKDHMRPDNVVYGLYRTTEQIDGSTTVKFCFIDWRGPNIPYMQRATLGTHSGMVQALFTPYHVDIAAGKDDEVTEDIILAKIRNASGTAHHVLN